MQHHELGHQLQERLIMKNIKLPRLVFSSTYTVALEIVNDRTRPSCGNFIVRARTLLN